MKKNINKFLILVLFITILLPMEVRATGDLELDTNITILKNNSIVDIPLKVNGNKDGLNNVRLSLFNDKGMEIISTSVKNNNMRNILFRVKVPKEATKASIVGLDKNNKICSNIINLYTDNLGITNRREKIVSVIDESMEVSMGKEVVFPEWINVKTNRGNVRKVPVENSENIDTFNIGNFEYEIKVPNMDIKGKFIVKVVDEKISANDEVIEFKDSNLEKAVRGLIGKASGDILKEDVKNIKKFRPIEYGVYELEDLSGIEHFESLEILDIDLMQVKDLSPVSDLYNLKWLYASNNPLNSIEPGTFSNLGNLEQLGLEGCGLTYLDEGTLKGLTNLDYLDLMRNDLIDVTGLKDTPKLRSLHLTDNRITDERNMEVIANLYNLKILSLDGNGITTIKPLSKMSNLTWLKVNRNFLKDLDGVEELRNLEKLEFSQNEIESLKDISALSKLKELKGNHNRLTNLDSLAGLKSIESIELFKNNIEDIEGLTNLKTLKKLDLNNNKIVDITTLSNLTNLTHIWLTNNNISNVEPLENLTNLYLLNIKEGNNIRDFSSLAIIYYTLKHKDFTI